MQYEDIKLFESFVLGVLKSFQSGKLKPCKDSRVSAGTYCFSPAESNFWDCRYLCPVFLTDLWFSQLLIAV